ncbi:MAG: hypothetical protein Q4D35_06505 [Ruminococcus sp.]|nr:hypothetical protein [Ruminococcus sp.]
MNMDEILDLMDGLLDKSTSVPFSNKRVIDCEQMREYVDTIRMNYQKEVKLARETAKEKDRIIDEANKIAEDIIKQAEERALTIASEEEVVKKAGEIANEQLKNAKQQADAIIADAIAKDQSIKAALAAKLDKALSDAERVLTRNLNEVSATKDAVLNLGSAE